jgi:3-oxoacyl-[acyl-carrier-protein] synthase III
LPIAQPEAVAALEAAPPASSAVPAGEQDVLHKALRFARLLVDEIKLYNLAQVSEGRKNKDLYDRLKDTIEKSRTTYQKRYGNTVAASANYFQDEMIRSLAEDDISIMGANFRR